jgi:hypothetical protein
MCATPVALICCLNVKGRSQAPFCPASIPPHSALVPPLLSIPHRSSSHQLPQHRVLFFASSVAIREPPAVDPSRPQASVPTGLKPTSSAFHREHLNAASHFWPPSRPDVAATSFASSVRTSTAHHPRRWPPGNTPHRRPYSTDMHHHGAAHLVSLLSPFPLKSVHRPSFMP